MEHNIEALRERFSNLLDALMYDFNLRNHLDEGSPEDIDCSWEEYNDAANHYGIWVGTGCTKFVIGDDNCDYIIKFQPPYVDEDAGEFDYCAREVEIYNEAVRAGYADKFAWCAHLFDYEVDGWVLPIYVMEWCQCSYDMIDDEMDDWHYTKYCSSRGIEKSDDAIIAYDNEGRNEKDYDERMMEWVYSVWGMDYYNPADDGFRQFMRSMYINDIHAGNWGWRGNKIVLVDYSGFGDNFNHRSMNY
jgi:hypothetical protein